MRELFDPFQGRPEPMVSQVAPTIVLHTSLISSPGSLQSIYLLRVTGCWTFRLQYFLLTEYLRSTALLNVKCVQCEIRLHSRSAHEAYPREINAPQ